jgi:hypothetical protein
MLRCGVIDYSIAETGVDCKWKVSPAFAVHLGRPPVAGRLAGRVGAGTGTPALFLRLSC